MLKEIIRLYRESYKTHEHKMRHYLLLKQAVQIETTGIWRVKDDSPKETHFFPSYLFQQASVRRRNIV
jgi:hypothetical protein